MELTNERQAILNGAQGPCLAKCMRWLAEWGEVMGARHLPTKAQDSGNIICAA